MYAVEKVSSLELLENRAKRLSNLAAVCANEQVILNEVLLVVKAAMQYSPEGMTETIQDWSEELSGVNEDEEACQTEACVN